MANMVADMEVDHVTDMVAEEVADRAVNEVADMEVDKMADIGVVGVSRPEGLPARSHVRRAHRLLSFL